jgi:hypothetical protein
MNVLASISDKFCSFCLQYSSFVCSDINNYPSTDRGYGSCVWSILPITMSGRPSRAPAAMSQDLCPSLQLLHGSQVSGRLLRSDVHNLPKWADRNSERVGQFVRLESALPLGAIAFLSALEVNSLSG